MEVQSISVENYSKMSFEDHLSPGAGSSLVGSPEHFHLLLLLRGFNNIIEFPGPGGKVAPDTLT